MEWTVCWFLEGLTAPKYWNRPDGSGLGGTQPLEGPTQTQVLPGHTEGRLHSDNQQLNADQIILDFFHSLFDRNFESPKKFKGYSTVSIRREMCRATTGLIPSKALTWKYGTTVLLYPAVQTGHGSGHDFVSLLGYLYLLCMSRYHKKTDWSLIFLVVWALDVDRRDSDAWGGRISNEILELQAHDWSAIRLVLGQRYVWFDLVTWATDKIICFLI